MAQVDLQIAGVLFLKSRKVGLQKRDGPGGQHCSTVLSPFALPNHDLTLLERRVMSPKLTLPPDTLAVMQTCPKCGQGLEAMARICRACGVIVSKVQAKTAGTLPAKPGALRALPPSLLPPPRPRPADRRSEHASKVAESSSRSEESDRYTSPGRATVKMGLTAGAAVLALFLMTKLSSPSRPAPPGNSGAFATAPTLSASDVTFLNSLGARVQKRSGPPVAEADVDRLGALYAANPNDSALKALVLTTYSGLVSARSVSMVYQCLRTLDGKLEKPSRFHEIDARVRAQLLDWEGAAAAALKYDAAEGENNLPMSIILARSLQALGRKGEALGVLDRPILGSCAGASTPEDVNACQMAAWVRKELGTPQSAPALAANPRPVQDETTVLDPIRPAAEDARDRAALQVDASKQQIRSDRFDVRFNGETQSGVARDVLSVLDRAYARLTDIYYDRPARKIQVVLHSSADYFSATGAPWWSGGQYSSHTGAIQIPIRGLPSSLPRQMEDVLVHELSHAFVDEMSGGRAGRDLQEGLAQYMEGKRVEQELKPAELKKLANSNGRSVPSFYTLSLVVSQQLVQSRGQGAINQLLKAMKDTGSEDAGFKALFGKPGADVKREILETFWRRYS